MSLSYAPFCAVSAIPQAWFTCSLPISLLQGLCDPLCVTHGSVGCFWLSCPVYNQPFIIGICVEWIPSKEEGETSPDIPPPTRAELSPIPGPTSDLVNKKTALCGLEWIAKHGIINEEPLNLQRTLLAWAVRKLLMEMSVRSLREMRPQMVSV